MVVYSSTVLRVHKHALVLTHYMLNCITSIKNMLSLCPIKCSNVHERLVYKTALVLTCNDGVACEYMIP